MSEAHRRAQATYVKFRTEQGHRKMTFWLTPAHRTKLERLAKIHGSMQLALEHMLEEVRVPWTKS